MRPNHGVIGLPRSRLNLGLSTGFCGLSSYAVHRKLAFTASSSRELFASSRVLRQTTCSPYLKRPCDLPIDRRAPPLGSPPSSRRQPAASTIRPGFPSRTLFRPRRFSRPRRFAPPPAFAGLFHPAATSRVCPTGVCPSPRSRTGFPRPRHALLPLDAAACDQRLRPRLQGFAPRRECGVGRSGLGLDRSAPLVGFSSSGCSPRATWECLHIPSALGLYREEPLAAGPRRLAVARMGLPGFRLPTRSSFLT